LQGQLHLTGTCAVFNHAEVSPFALADFAVRCGIDRKLMRREGHRLAKLAATEVTVQAQAYDYVGEEERAWASSINIGMKSFKQAKTGQDEWTVLRT
jgi:hypothetical protein